MGEDSIFNPYTRGLRVERFERSHLTIVGLKSTPLDHSGIHALVVTCPAHPRNIRAPIFIPSSGLYNRFFMIYNLLYSSWVYKYTVWIHPIKSFATYSGRCTNAGSNRRPSAHKTDALTNWANKANDNINQKK